MHNIKQLRDKYDQIKQVRDKSVRSQMSVRSQLSMTPIREPEPQKRSIIQIGKTLLCGPCYNKRMIDKKHQQCKQSAQEEKKQLLAQIQSQVELEHRQQWVEGQQTQRRRAMEENNLKTSLLNQEQQKKAQRQLKDSETEYEQYIMKKNMELDQIEKQLKLTKQKQLNMDLKQQIQYKTQQKLNSPREVSQDAPYWKYFTIEEEERNRRKNKQEQYVRNNWSFYESEKKRQQQIELEQRNQEQNQRLATMKEMSVKSRDAKIAKNKQSHALTLDLKAQIKLKKAKQDAQKLMERQLQREWDKYDQVRDAQRNANEQYQRSRIRQDMSVGLQQQQQYKNSQPKQVQELYESSIISPAQKCKIDCSDCHRPQEQQLLSVL